MARGRRPRLIRAAAQRRHGRQQPVPEQVGPQPDGHPGVRRQPQRAVQVHHGRPARVPAVEFHGHVRVHAGDQPRIDDPGDRDGVVHRGRGETPQPPVGAREEAEQFGADPPEVRVQGLETGDDLGRREGLVGDVQAAHGHRYTAAEDDVRGLRVGVDVELGGRGPVPPVRGPAHQHDLPDPARQLGVPGQQQGDVRQGSRRHQGDRLRVPGQDPPQQLHRVLGLGRQGRLGETGAVQPRHPVHVVGHPQRLHQRSRAPGGDRNPGDAGDGAHPQRVQGGLLHSLVARHRGDGQQVHPRVARGEEDREGVVVPRIAVDDDGNGNRSGNRRGNGNAHDGHLSSDRRLRGAGHLVGSRDQCAHRGAPHSAEWSVSSACVRSGSGGAPALRRDRMPGLRSEERCDDHEQP